MSTVFSNTGGSSSSNSPKNDAENLRRNRILSSKLYLDVPPSKVPLIYSSSYDISFLGIEKLHPFDSSKWGRICQFLVVDGILEKKRIVEPLEATRDDLLVVHSEAYLNSLKNSSNISMIIEVPPVALFPHCLVQQKVLHPFRKQVGGTILAAKLAKERGWAINVGGGFHHCCAEKGGGFCVYADISLCIHFAFVRLNISRVMIIDLDAHQGNGHEQDFSSDSMISILPCGLLCVVINLYSFHWQEEFISWICTIRISILLIMKQGGTLIKKLKFGRELQQVSTCQNWMKLLRYFGWRSSWQVEEGEVKEMQQKCCWPQISPSGIATRDEKVFRFAHDRSIPLVMLTSGGYMRSSARVIADSIENLSKKSLIDLQI